VGIDISGHFWWLKRGLEPPHYTIHTNDEPRPQLSSNFSADKQSSESTYDASAVVAKSVEMYEDCRATEPKSFNNGKKHES
jgi:hypothetical protein